jgi:hypothetical protein
MTAKKMCYFDRNDIVECEFIDGGCEIGGKWDTCKFGLNANQNTNLDVKEKLIKIKGLLPAHKIAEEIGVSIDTVESWTRTKSANNPSKNNSLKINGFNYFPIKLAPWGDIFFINKNMSVYQLFLSIEGNA